MPRRRRGGVIPTLSVPSGPKDLIAVQQTVRTYLVDLYTNMLKPAMQRKKELEEVGEATTDVDRFIQSMLDEVGEMKREYLRIGRGEREWNKVLDDALIKVGLKQRD